MASQIDFCARKDRCRQPNECLSVGCCLDVVTETELVAAQEAYVDAREARRALFKRANDTGWSYDAIGKAVQITGAGIWHLLAKLRVHD